MPPLSTSDLLQFQEQGFLLIQGIYAPEDLQAARAWFQAAFADAGLRKGEFDSNTLLTDIYTHFPELADIVFNERYCAVAKALLGNDVVLIPECAVHRERYIDWHKDTTVQEMAGLTTHAYPDASPILQFATYFQENGRSGGGLTVIPGSHLWPDPFLKVYSSNLAQRIWNKLLKIMGLSLFNKLEKHPGKLHVPLRLGDLLVFDVRIFHRATFPLVTGGPEKFAIFNTCIRQEKAGIDYFHFMKQRPEPYYRYFREIPLSPVVAALGEKRNIHVMY